jgi:tetratricopeptide (TPR) repeat protein
VLTQERIDDLFAEAEELFDAGESAKAAEIYVYLFEVTEYRVYTAARLGEIHLDHMNDPAGALPYLRYCDEWSGERRDYLVWLNESRLAVCYELLAREEPRRYGWMATLTRQRFEKALESLLKEVLPLMESPRSVMEEVLPGVGEQSDPFVGYAMLLVNSYLARKEYSTSRYWLETSLEREPNNAELWMLMGDVNLVVDRFHEALRCYEYLYAQSRMGQADYREALLNNIAYAYMSIGQPQKALKYLKEGLEHGSQYRVRLLDTLAEVYEKLGQTEKALMCYREVRSLDPDFENVSEKIRRIEKENEVNRGCH